MNLVPFSQFNSDLTNGTFPTFSFIVPNTCNDAHDCSLGTADSWLQSNIDPLVQNIKNKSSGNGGNQNDLLVVVFDEDSSCGSCNNQVYLGLFSPAFSKPGYVSSTEYKHQNTLRTIMQGLGLTTYPGDAASANPMTDFFNTSNSSTFALTVSPTSRTVKRGSSTTYTVTASSQNGFSGTVYLHGKGVPTGSSGSFNPSHITLTSGSSGTSTATVNVGSTTKTGTYTLTITGKSGNVSQSVKVTLTVTN
jgi:hypothetical protein